MNRVAIIGHFGNGKNLLNGQTIKTKILYSELLQYYSKNNIFCVDTRRNSKLSYIRILFQILYSFVISDCVIILAAKKGKIVLFPIVHYINKLFKKRIFHDCIAGNIHELTIERPVLKKYLKSFEENWLELESITKKMIDEGITNCVHLPNFKRIEIIEEKEIRYSDYATIRFCTFSRVSAQKGIVEAVNVINALNLENDKTKLQLDIYGQIEYSFADEFKEILNKQSDSINYCGEVAYELSTGTLKKYDILLFPTKHTSEGFPGTIIDAFAAGLPVIASFNSELVQNGITGYTYKGSDEIDLYESIKELIDRKDEINLMKLNCIKEARKYLPDSHIKYIVSAMENIK